MATIEERFTAAVNVIKNLPKNGSYQPSSAMMLTFYSYFKQATVGPCTHKKPPFWEVVSRAKYDAWAGLGQMSKERAMQLYVDELKKIIETMSFTDTVANFVGSIDELNNVSFEDLETVAPDTMKKARSHPNSPFNSRGNSPHLGISSNGHVNGDTNECNELLISQNSFHSSNIDQSDDEYIDTVEDNVEMPLNKKHKASQVQLSNNCEHSSRSDSSYEITKEHVNKAPINPAVLQQILMTVQNMNADINAVNKRIDSMEKHILDLRKTFSQNIQKTHRTYPSWWPFDDISPKWFILLIIWPFIANRLGQIGQRKK